MALTTFERAVGIAGIIAAIAGVIAIVPKDWYTDSDSHTGPTTSVITATTNPTPDTSDASPGWQPSPQSPAPEVPVTSEPTSRWTPAPQAPATTTDAPPPIPVVNRLDISTWAYNKTAPNSYRADNNGGKSVRVDWTARADGHEIDGACASSARVQGPDTDQAKDSSNCSSSVWFDIHQPGNYTVTVTTHQDSGAEYSQNINLAIVP